MSRGSYPLPRNSLLHVQLTEELNTPHLKEPGYSFGPTDHLSTKGRYVFNSSHFVFFALSTYVNCPHPRGVLGAPALPLLHSKNEHYRKPLPTIHSQPVLFRIMWEVGA